MPSRKELKHKGLSSSGQPLIFCCFQGIYHVRNAPKNRDTVCFVDKLLGVCSVATMPQDYFAV